MFHISKVGIMDSLIRGQVHSGSRSAETSGPRRLSQLLDSQQTGPALVPLGQQQDFHQESQESVDMPRLARQSLAKRLQMNWNAKHPREKATLGQGLQLDDSLTNLSWLLSLKAVPTPPSSPEPLESADGAYTYDDSVVDPNSVLHLTSVVNIKKEPGTDDSLSSTGSPPSPTSGPMFSSTSGFYTTTPRQGSVSHVTFTPCTPPAEVDYRTNHKVKPPYSYATLIRMALNESAEGKLTLADIYGWITENFIYFRHADTSWQNSIRHNLSLNKSFQKVPRRKDEPGKGGFWQINPEFNDTSANSIYKKRSVYTRDNVVPTLTLGGPPAKKTRREQEDAVSTLVNSEVYNTEELTGILGLSGGDVSWSTILSQDIEVGGIRIKTEALLDSEDDSNAADPITSCSPPPSNSSSDAGLDGDYLQSDLSSDMDNPTDYTSGQPLDLSINGFTLHPSGWWSEKSSDSLNASSHSGLNTPPRCPSPGGGVPTDLIAHAWAESQAELLDQALTTFDLEMNSMFDVLSDS